MRREIVRSVLNELQQKLGIEGKVRVEIRTMRTKAASVSIRRGVIRLNKHIVNSEEQCLRYLILHELAHLKLGSTSHGDDFYRILYSVMSRDEVEDSERRIIKSLIRLNRGSPF